MLGSRDLLCVMCVVCLHGVWVWVGCVGSVGCVEVRVRVVCVFSVWVCALLCLSRVAVLSFGSSLFFFPSGLLLFFVFCFVFYFLFLIFFWRSFPLGCLGWQSHCSCPIAVAAPPVASDWLLSCHHR